MSSHISPSPQIVGYAKAAGISAAWIGLGLSALAILGSVVGLPILTTGLSHRPPIHLFSATCSGLMAIAILLRYFDRGKWLASALAIVVLILTCFVLLMSFAQGIEAGVLGQGLSNSGLKDIPPNSALCLGFVSLGFILYQGSRRSQLYGQFIVLLSAIVSALALIGYSYAVESLYNVGHVRAMSLPGAIDYFLIAVSLLLLRSDLGLFRIVMSDHPVGRMWRKLNLAVFVALPLLGLITILIASSAKSDDIPYAIAFLVVSSMILLSSVVAFVSHRLEAADAVQVATQVSLRESQMQLRKLSAHSQKLQEEERVRIAREVHDELGQSLTALKMDVALLRNISPNNLEDLEHRTASMMDLVNHTIKSVQRISSELRPSVLDNLGLAAAIEWQTKEFCTRANLTHHLHVADEAIPIESARSTALFRIFQETLTNIGRHAVARNVWISLRCVASDLILEVRDDGNGMHGADINDPQSLGIIGMQERAALLGGTIEFSSPEATGTRVTVTIPVQLTQNYPTSESLPLASADVYD